jgi:NAD(P)-dependent dehydrogenase (short-subunit alcohol dehydrogenase family)
MVIERFQLEGRVALVTGAGYLASPESAWVTGRVIGVDGGAAEPPLQFPVPGLAERLRQDAK